MTDDIRRIFPVDATMIHQLRREQAEGRLFLRYSEVENLGRQYHPYLAGHRALHSLVNSRHMIPSSSPNLQPAIT